MPRKSKTFEICFLGLLLALAIALSFAESMIPVLPLLPLGVKMGLSNIVVMYCVFFLGAKKAFLLAFIKSLFVMLTRAPTSGFISLLGGLLSVLVMCVLIKLLPNLSPRYISIAGAVSHNLGQLVGATIILSSSLTLYYLPIMIISGIMMGLVTGVLLRLIMPYLKNLGIAF